MDEVERRERARRYGYSFCCYLPAVEVLINYVLSHAPELTLGQAKKVAWIADSYLCEDDYPLTKAVAEAIRIFKESIDKQHLT